MFVFSLVQQSNDVSYMVDGVILGASLECVQGHPVVHFHRSDQFCRLHFGVSVACALKAGYVVSDGLQFFVADLILAEGGHSEPGGAYLALHLCLGVARQGRGNR